MQVTDKSSLSPEHHASSRSQEKIYLLQPITRPIGRYRSRTTNNVRLIQKSTTARTMTEFVAEEGWVILSVKTLSSNDIIINSANNVFLSAVGLTWGGVKETVHFAPDSEYFSLSVPQNVLQKCIPLSLRESKKTMVLTITYNFNQTLLRDLQKLMDEPSSKEDFESKAIEIINQVMSVWQEEKIRHKLSSRFRFVRFSVNYVTNHFDDKLTVIDIARAAHCSSRTLNYAFKLVLGLTPKQFLEYYRLNKYRQRLIADPTQNQGDIAYEVGYKHLGNLAKSYYMLFGELPSETTNYSKVRMSTII